MGQWRPGGPDAVARVAREVSEALLGRLVVIYPRYTRWTAATCVWTYIQTEADRDGREYDLVHIPSLSCFVLPETPVLK